MHGSADLLARRGKSGRIRAGFAPDRHERPGCAVWEYTLRRSARGRERHTHKASRIFPHRQGPAGICWICRHWAEDSPRLCKFLCMQKAEKARLRLFGMRVAGALLVSRVFCSLLFKLQGRKAALGAGQNALRPQFLMRNTARRWQTAADPFRRGRSCTGFPRCARCGPSCRTPARRGR